jgi:hypothetical protein
MGTGVLIHGLDSQSGTGPERERRSRSSSSTVIEVCKLYSLDRYLVHFRDLLGNEG